MTLIVVRVSPTKDTACVSLYRGSLSTGCSTVSVPTLILNNFFISGKIIEPFNSMKVEMIRICLVYKTLGKVQCFSIYDHHEFWQKIACFALSLNARYPDSDIEATATAFALIVSKLRISDDMTGDF